MESYFKKILVTVYLVLFAQLAMASEDFVVKRIQILGLNNLMPSTVYSYLPIKQGQQFSYKKSKQILKTLYETEMFDKVSLARQGSTLVVSVVERPMITLVKIDGNKDIPTDKIQPVLKQLGVSVGSVYDPLKLKLFEQSLEQQYSMMGYASAKVSSTVKSYPHNRVEIDIKVEKIKVVTVNSIHFVGNKHVSSRKLEQQLALSSSNLLTWFTHKDRYSEFTLRKSLNDLSNFYLNHGYAEFRVTDHNVIYSDDHKKVDLTITVDEGAVYNISDVRIVGDGLKSPTAAYEHLSVKKGDIFSRQKILASQQSLKQFLADKGYAFAVITVRPKINNIEHTVFIEFNIGVGKQVYVRRINFMGNAKTDQEVLRREMLQMEAAPYSLTDVEKSKRRLLMLPYFPRVEVTTTPVIEDNNQVDLTYHVEEKPAGKASIQGGYSSANGFLYGASITQPNFLGTGKYVAVGFTNSEYSQRYFISYTDPYYLWNRVSRGFNIYYNLNHYSETYNYTPYTMDTYGADLKYGFPLSENNSLNVDFGYVNTHVFNVDQTKVAPSVKNFMDPDGTSASQFLDETYNVTKTSATWSYNGLDRYLMPTRGVRNQLSLNVGVPILNNNLTYYTITDNFSAYVPIGYGFLLNFTGNVGYGRSYDSPDDDLFPFMYNFHAGGIGMVSGYQQNSLGPKYATGSAYAGSSLGGNLLTVAGAHLVLPDFFNKTLRVALTFEAGNVFQDPVYGPDASQPNLVTQDDSFALKNMRMSAGVLVVWVVPMFGPIDLSLAYPINKQSGDQSQPFQFAMGISF